MQNYGTKLFNAVEKKKPEQLINLLDEIEKTGESLTPLINNQRVSDGMTLLHMTHSPAIAKILLECNADPNRGDRQGKRPLHFAINHKKFQVVSLLLKCKANPYQPDEYGYSPIEYTAKNNNTEKLIYLLEHTTNPITFWLDTPKTIKDRIEKTMLYVIHLRTTAALVFQKRLGNPEIWKEFTEQLLQEMAELHLPLFDYLNERTT